MSKLLLIGIGLAVFLIAAAFFLAKISQTTPPRPQVQVRLQECPDSPNCVSSENYSIAPIAINGKNPEAIWSKLQQTITEQGGQLMEVQPHYLWATFKTPIFGFIDDVEARMDLTDNVIHLRSASRVGYYDFGANRKRLLNLKAKIQVYLTPKLQKNKDE